MAKKPKAIELVFRAQPAMALLLEVMKSQKGMEGDLFAQDIQRWLDDAGEILKRKDRK